MFVTTKTTNITPTKIKHKKQNKQKQQTIKIKQIRTNTQPNSKNIQIRKSFKQIKNSKLNKQKKIET